MLSQSPCWYLEIEAVEDVTVCRFRGRGVYLDEAGGQGLRDELDALIDHEGRHQLVLDFANVTYFAGATRNMLISLHHRLRALGGWLIICGLNSQLREVFEVTRLNTFLDIRAAEPEELAVAC